MRYCCQNSDCTLSARRNAGNLSVCARYGNQDHIRLLYCNACQYRSLQASVCRRTVNPSFVERQHATDRGRKARKTRKTHQFSKDWRVHEAMTDFTLYSDTFCCAVRTLRTRRENARWQSRTPAMVAGLAQHVWSLREWLTFPAVQ